MEPWLTAVVSPVPVRVMSLAASTSVFETVTWQLVPFVTEMSRTSPADGVRLLSLAATLQSALRLIVAALKGTKTSVGDAGAAPPIVVEATAMTDVSATAREKRAKTDFIWQ